MLGIPNPDKVAQLVTESVGATRELAKAITSLAAATNRQTDALIAANQRSQKGTW